MPRKFRRSHFLAGFSGAIAAGAFVRGRARADAGASLATAAPTVPGASDVIRVKLFGPQVIRLEFAGDTGLSLALPSGTVSATAVSFDLANVDSVVADGRTLPTGGEPAQISSPGLIVASATDAAGRSTQRRYAGAFSVSLESSNLVVINSVNVEAYVASTLASEVGAIWHPESLKAQAIVSRTFGLSARSRSAKRAFDVTDDTSSQVYRGADNVAQPFVDAAAATAGKALYDGGAVAQVFYSAVCGGHTASVQELSGRLGPSYLSGIVDADRAGRAYCARAQYFQWKNEISADALARVMSTDSDTLADVVVIDRWSDGRVKTIRALRTDGSSSDLDGHKFYSAAAGALGYKVVPSSLFDLHRSGPVFQISGHGLGHGVGMCQWGARGRAESGAPASAIVAAYFPGTSIR